jgi:predicted Fe-Mo cluster-binding NifX family protein
VSREAAIVTIENGTVAARSSASIETPNPELRIARLIELGIDTLICGAISEPLRTELTIRGVRVVGFVAGEVDDVIQAFIAGGLPAPALSMPGCCRKQNRFRWGPRQGGGCRRGRGMR